MWKTCAFSTSANTLIFSKDMNFGILEFLPQIWTSKGNQLSSSHSGLTSRQSLTISPLTNQPGYLGIWGALLMNINELAWFVAGQSATGLQVSNKQRTARRVQRSVFLCVMVMFFLSYARSVHVYGDAVVTLYPQNRQMLNLVPDKDVWTLKERYAGTVILLLNINESPYMAPFRAFDNKKPVG